MDLNYLSEIAMQVISYGGMAKSEYINALNEYKKNNKVEGDRHIEEGDNYSLEAHKCHTKALNKEMKDKTSQISLLLTHAEDQLMSSEIIRLLVIELGELYFNK